MQAELSHVRFCPAEEHTPTSLEQKSFQRLKRQFHLVSFFIKKKKEKRKPIENLL